MRNRWNVSRPHYILTVVMALALPSGCGSSSSTSCPNDLPAACVAPAPSYESTISGIINLRCGSCHVPGGQESAVLLQTYDEVYAQRSAVLNQVYACTMPQAGAPQPTLEERQQLLMWLVCGAPQN